MLTLLLIAIFLIIGVWLLRPSRLRIGNETRCKGCEYDLRGFKAPGTCPECGSAITPKSGFIRGTLNTKRLWWGRGFLIAAGLVIATFITQRAMFTHPPKPIWWLRVEYLVLRSDRMQFFQELEGRMRAAPSGSPSARRLATAILDESNSIPSNSFEANIVLEAYTHLPPKVVNAHAGNMIRAWADMPPDGRMEAGWYLDRISIHHAETESAILPLVEELEKLREHLPPDPNLAEIDQAMQGQVRDLLQTWWFEHGDTASSELAERIRGDPVSAFVRAPTYLVLGESWPIVIYPAFAGLWFNPDGWVHLRVTEARVGGEVFETDWPIEFQYALNGAGGTGPFALDLSDLTPGEHTFEFDIEAIDTPNPDFPDHAWDAAYRATLSTRVRIFESASERDAFLASDALRDDIESSIILHSLEAVRFETEVVNVPVIQTWLLSFEIQNCPVELKHEVLIEQGEHTWQMEICTLRPGESRSYIPGEDWQQIAYHRAPRNPSVVPDPDAPVTIRLTPWKHGHAMQPWDHDIVLGPMLPADVGTPARE